MAELNEEQLLELSNMMYYAGSTKEGASLEDVANQMKKDAEKARANGGKAGGMEPDQAEEIANAILNDPELSELVIVNALDTTGVRAATLVNPSGEATIAIKGTGPTFEEWSDDFQGGYQRDTDAQISIYNYVKKQTQDYTDITVTGHSKGGNLAQYVTVRLGDSVDRCVSYDGQGFGDDFIGYYSSEIAENRAKIKSICAEGDYVNILLNSIAGETVYLKNNVDSFGDQHSPFKLWQTNKGTISNGCYSEKVEQLKIAAMLEETADSITHNLGNLDSFQEMIIYNILGSAVALILSKDYSDLSKIQKDFDYLIQDIIRDAMRENSEWLVNPKGFFDTITQSIAISKDELAKIIDTIKKAEDMKQNKSVEMVGNGHDIVVDSAVLRTTSSGLDIMLNNLDTLEENLGTLNLKGSIRFLFMIKANALRKTISNERKKVEVLKKTLIDILDAYEKTENVCRNI